MKDLSDASLDEVLSFLRERPLLWIGSDRAHGLSLFLTGFFAGQRRSAGGANAKQLIHEFGRAVGAAFGITSFFGWASIVQSVASHRGLSELEVFWQLWDEFRATGRIQKQSPEFDLQADLERRYEVNQPGAGNS